MLSTMTPDLRASSPIPTLGSYVQTRSHTHLSSMFTRTQVHESKRRGFLSDFDAFMGLLMSVVGAGMLSVPHTFVAIPTAQAVIGTLIVGVSMGATANALLHAHVQVASKEELRVRHVGAGKRVASFQSLAVKAGGNVFGYIVSAVTALGIFGGCVGCIRIVRDMTPFMVVLMYSLINNGSVDVHTAIPASDQKAAEQILLWGLFVVVVFPLCLLKNLSALKVTNYLGFLFSIYLVVVITYRSSQSVQRRDAENAHNDTIVLNATVTANAFDVPSRENVRDTPATIDFAHSTSSFPCRRLRSEHDTEQDPLEAPAIMEREAQSPSSSHASRFSRFAQSVSIYNFAFMMHLNLLPVFIQLRGSFDRPMTETRTHMTKGIAVVALFCITLYLVFGLCGAKLYGESINGNVLLNLENDPAMKIPLVAVYLTVIVTFPLLFHPMRSVVEEILRQRNRVGTTANASSTTGTAAAPARQSPKQRVALTTALLGTALLVATRVPRIEIVFALLGATTCTMVCFVFPIAIFTRVYPWQRNARGRAWAAALWLIVAFEVVMGGAAVIFVLTSR